MTALTTSFRLLRKYHACTEGREKLVRHLGGEETYGADTPIPIAVILDSNDIFDTLWSLRAVPKDQHADRDRVARLFAADCAEHVLHYFEARFPDDKRPRNAIEVARRYANGDATADELRIAYADAVAARRAAYGVWAAAAVEAVVEAAAAAAVAAAAAAAEAAVAVAEAAAAAVAEAAAAAERAWQANHLREMLTAPEPAVV